MRKAAPRILALLLLVSAVVSLLVLYRRLGLSSRSQEELRRFVASFGAGAPLVFVLLTFLQVTLIPIPSTVTVLGGSYLFGALPSFFYSYVGLLLGSLFAFLLGRLLGRRFVYWLAGSRERVDTLLLRARDREVVALFLMFLFPAFPDDLLCLVAGLLPISLPAFLLMQLLSRATSVGATLLFFSGEVIPFSGWGIPVMVVAALGGLVLCFLSLRYSATLTKILDRMTATVCRLFKKRCRRKEEDDEAR